MRVLVVDDEPMVRALLAELLESRGHRVTQAGGVDEARAIADDGEVDAVVIDDQMPGCRGTTWLAETVAARPALAGRAIVIFGGEMEAARRSSLGRAGVRWVAKPFRIEDLVRLLETVELSAESP